MDQIRGRGKNIGRLLRSLFVSMGMTFVLLMILALLLLKLQPDMGTTEAGILVVYALSSLAGGWSCGRKAEKRKFAWGMASGVLYFAVLIAGSGMNGQFMKAGISQNLIAFLICSGAGMVGGMLA